MSHNKRFYPDWEQYLIDNGFTKEDIKRVGQLLINKGVINADKEVQPPFKDEGIIRQAYEKTVYRSELDIIYKGVHILFDDEGLEFLLRLLQSDRKMLQSIEPIDNYKIISAIADEVTFVKHPDVENLSPHFQSIIDAVGNDWTSIAGSFSKYSTKDTNAVEDYSFQDGSDES